MGNDLMGMKDLMKKHISAPETSKKVALKDSYTHIDVQERGGEVGIRVDMQGERAIAYAMLEVLVASIAENDNCSFEDVINEVKKVHTKHNSFDSDEE